MKLTDTETASRTGFNCYKVSEIIIVCQMFDISHKCSKYSGLVIRGKKVPTVYKYNSNFN